MQQDVPYQEDDDMTATDNAGGRVDFTVGERKRYLDLSGAISPDVYLIQQTRSDRKGFVALKQENGTRTISVHHRRLLPVSLNGEAVVIESTDKYYALCPHDNWPMEVQPTDQSTTCPQCSQTFNLFWTGAKPMTDAKASKPQVAKTPKPEKSNKQAPKEPKPPKTPKEPIKVDLVALAQLKDCELWTKKGVKFDHERIDVQAHMLLFIGTSPRKLSFNTYNGMLGKKVTTALPIDQFLANEANLTKVLWYAIPDLEKARKKLLADLYEQCT